MVVAKALAASAANNVLSLVMGKRYDLDDPLSSFVEGLLTKFLRHAAIFSHYDFFPLVRFFATYIPNTRMHAMNQVFSGVSKLVRDELKEREGNMEAYSDKDFIGGYFKKLQNNNVSSSYYNMRHLEGNSLNFLAAATNTVRTSVLWNLCIAASDPDGHQARAQREIDAALGQDSAPTWDDRHRLPYTMATVLETLRWRTIAPLGINRSTGRDTVICGYDIPAGTIVLPNLWAVHNDETHWHQPYLYDPTRFLNSDGTAMEQRPQAFLAFSFGIL
ncbi:hypothetical protein HPB52_017492 [Rhipicephalus sanguineus]|uniref:Cytochrome P450 n=1 Tax=Rhipicephalus sanguineus TaxID=34632 RepID=A0A9D4T4B9_RHISA|nr:hypothetical protein HPB52_017492 [Rhipicephalus sanguineus]